MPPVSAPIRRRCRPFVLLLPATLLATAGSLAAATPAHAVTVASIADVTTALAGCTGTEAAPTVVTLGQDIAATTTTVTVPCVAEFDLAGHELRVRNIAISAGQQLTVDDSATGGRLTVTSTANSTPGIRTTDAKLIVDGGTVTAQGGPASAGIGGPTSSAAGTVVINGGEVTATGGGTIACAGIGGLSSNVTINGGRITATGGTTTNRGAAGIGGCFGQGGGVINVNGGTVIATGSGTTSNGGAGIGSGNNSIFGGGTPEQSSGGQITITGGTVTATGGVGAAGIGGGRAGTGGTITITGGTVTATGSGAADPAAGIGGGFRSTYWSGNPGLGSGGTVLIGEGADVTATGGYTAVGSGALSTVQTEPTAVGFGSLRVDGTLRIPTGFLRIQDSNAAGPEITVGSTGRILGTVAEPTTGATIAGTALAGTGQIRNDGAIALTDDLVTGHGVEVLGHHYAVSFDTHGGSPAAPADPVTVFAPSFDAGYRAYPYATAPTRTGDRFKGWNTAADGSGVAVTATSTLPGDSTDGDPVAITAHARWASGPVIETRLPDDAVTISTTSDASFTPEVFDSDGDPYLSDPGTWSITDAGGTVTATIDPTTGQVTVSSTVVGSHTLTLSVPTPAGAVTVEITVTVEPSNFRTGPSAAFTGTLEVGETLTADAGTIDPAPDAVAFVWLANGAEVGTGPTYTLTAQDAGALISVRAVASRAGYADASDTSAEAGPVLGPSPSPTPTPSPTATASSTTAPRNAGDLPQTGSDLPGWVPLSALLVVPGVVLLLLSRRLRRQH
ncbi:MAG: InlB B-repeat-containing protein [Micropruina sp.]|uniref:InlB B-repeat-containing protein n=1 Tax=Micropruina sp. TaxID=2737536 RepID=UPI0039E3B0AC